MGIDVETKTYLDECRTGFPSAPPDKRVVHGFDGYIDRVREMIEFRSGPEEFETMDSLATLEHRISESATRNNSCSIEWTKQAKRAGGHTSHMGRAFSALGFSSTVIGTYGSPPGPIFERELGSCDLISVGSPSYSDAVEFNDGKLMLNEIGSMKTLDWNELQNRVGSDRLAELIDGAAALSIGYWSTIPFLPGIWDGLSQDVWPSLSNPPETVFIDPADVRRMSMCRLKSGLESLQRLDERAPVTVSTNRKETEVLASVSENGGTDLATAAKRARNELGVSRYFAHTVDRAVVVTDGTTAHARTPQVTEPELMTSAGDHFNVGAILGDLLGLSVTSSLILGNVAANWFVRNGSPPSFGELHEFLDEFGRYFR